MTNSQEIVMPFATDVTGDASSICAATVASAFDGLIYIILISRSELAATITVFAVNLVSRLVTDIGTVHQGGLQVLCSRYLQEVCSSLSGGVWTYTKAKFLRSSAVLLQ